MKDDDMLKKPAETLRDVHPLIRDRWSPRAFDASKPVSTDDLISVLEAARWTASSNNVQPWRFIVATSANPEEHAKAVQGFNARNQRWAQNAPVLVFALARKVTDDGAPNGAAHYDTGAAVAQLTTQATALGLSVHQAGGIDKDKIRATYDVPEDTDILVGFGLGYQADASVLPEDLAQREVTPRARKSLQDIVYTGAYGTSLSV
jgi:nitroreductase